jgi:hypothetical protein
MLARLRGGGEAFGLGRAALTRVLRVVGAVLIHRAGRLVLVGCVELSEQESNEQDIDLTQQLHCSVGLRGGG